MGNQPRSYEVPTICRYCGGVVRLTSAKTIYRKGNQKIYLCCNCNSYVNCYKNSDRPMGKLANAALRMKRQVTHEVFDQYWKRRGMTRDQAYRWLAQKLKLPLSETHIAYMEMDGCERVIKLCRAAGADVAA